MARTLPPAVTAVASNAETTTARPVPKRAPPKAAPKSIITDGSEIAKTMAAINKQYGKETAIMAHKQRQPWRIPTGIFMFDLATCGGIPHNRVTMFHGPRSSGKTTAAEKAIAGAQRSMPGMQAAFLDIEHTRDAEWGAKLGVNNEELIYVNAETGENAVDIADALIRSKEISLIVVDSIAALVPMKEITSSAEDAHVGLQSRLVSGMMRKITAGLLAERMRGHYVTILVINQQRTKIGGWSPTGEPLSLPGGKALEFTTSVQARFANKETSSTDERGFSTLEFNEHAFTLDKCKMNGGIRKGEYRLMRRDSTEFNLFEGDIDDAGTMLAHAKKIGCYTGGGRSWTIDVPNFNMTFGSADQAIGHLYENREDYWYLRNHLIADHASSLKFPQYFIDYLYGD